MTTSLPKTDIWLLTASTPNGQKISCTLEELGIDYESKKIDITKDGQKEPWFLKINPNGRIPAIVDRTKSPNVPVFESGSIMLYLCENYDPEHRISYPYNTSRYWQLLQWLFFMNAGVGPMQGQANHFYRCAPEKIKYGIDRYQNETKRLYGILDKRLEEQGAQDTVGGDATVSNKGPWLVGEKMTVADIANFCWVNWAEWAGVNIDQFPHLKDWRDRINARPAIQKGLDVPEPFEMKKKMQSKEGEKEFEKYHSEWVMKGQNDEAEKQRGGR